MSYHLLFLWFASIFLVVLISWAMAEFFEWRLRRHRSRWRELNRFYLQDQERLRLPRARK